ncbi:AAA family ATPase [Paracoccus sp. ME4]|uniref:AAA family ATPase n=1 Tax=Paracoccus sp. ME4 TaxID=3138066 RepID=UPI00398A9980
MVLTDDQRGARRAFSAVPLPRLGDYPVMTPGARAEASRDGRHRSLRRGCEGAPILPMDHTRARQLWGLAGAGAASDALTDLRRIAGDRRLLARRGPDDAVLGYDLLTETADGRLISTPLSGPVHALGRIGPRRARHFLVTADAASVAMLAAARPDDLVIVAASGPSRTGRRSTQNQSYDTKVITGLLEQLDGIDRREGVTIIAACNHPDAIDPAILRAGRFDTRVEIGLPDAAALATILRQHLGGELPGADLSAMSQMAFGLSGADGAAAVRAARGAARRERRPLTVEDLRAALAPDHRALPAEMRRRAAVHEAGHAVVTTALGLGRVRLLRLGPQGGETRLRWFDLDATRDMLQRRCAAELAGRAAEILLIGDAGGGAGGSEDGDLHRATLLMLQRDLCFGLGA